MDRVSRSVLTAVAAAGCALLAGCAAPERVTVTTPGTTVTATSTTVSVRTGSGAGHLVLTVDVPSGAPGCGANLRATTNETPAAVVVTTAVDSTAVRCPATAHRELDVTVPELAGRELVVDGSRWTSRDGELQACSGPLGCTAPPADHCDQAYLTGLTATADLPNVSTSVRSCDQQWLVLDVESSPTECTGAGNQPIVGGCSLLRRESRWFARFDDAAPGWVLLAQGRQAGCADLTRAGATFPPELCRDLPAR